jgi:hypothetical protein
MQGASPGDIIIFDRSVFPMSNPQTIYLRSTLPNLDRGNVTIDGGAAGVILDGSNFPDGWWSGIQVLSNNNIIRGLMMLNFSGAALQISGGQNNLIEGNVIGNSDYGIGVWGVNALGNRITANFLGVMPDGVAAVGNKTAGIVVMDDAHDNYFGPGNQIAFNGRSGIEIYQAGTVRNEIFENSIHNNSGVGINLMSGGNNDIPAPLLMDFDTALGKVSGTACPNCKVHIYSDEGDEGAVFEGVTTANEDGVFSYEKGAEINGGFLTATATDQQGNTSGFSLPAITITLQSGNPQPRTWLVTKPSVELADNRTGAAVAWELDCSEQYLENALFILGAKHVKVSISEIEPESQLGDLTVTTNWSRSEFAISQDQENCIKALLDNGLSITYILSFWDKANHPEGWQPPISRFRTQEEIQQYLDYVRFIVRHFKGRISYYEIWNEPNNQAPLQWIQVGDYINLVKQTVPVIEQEDPDAKIVIGGIVLQGEGDRAYLFDLLKSELMTLVDVISWHSMYGVSPEYQSEYYYGYPAIVESIKYEAGAHGFQGEYWADELLWRDPDCYWCDPGDPLYSNIVSAKYHARGIIIQLGMDLKTQVTGISGIRPYMFATVRNIMTIMAGNKPFDLPVEIQTTATLVRSYGFVMPHGENILAVWNDAAALDINPGIPTTIIIPGFSGWTATGIDILNGFEQEFITTDENGKLVISNFLLKDYPIIIRLSK